MLLCTSQQRACSWKIISSKEESFTVPGKCLCTPWCCCVWTKRGMQTKLEHINQEDCSPEDPIGSCRIWPSSRPGSPGGARLSCVINQWHHWWHQCKWTYVCLCVLPVCRGDPLSLCPLCSSVPQSLEGMKVDSHSHPLQVRTHTNRTVCNPSLGIRFQPLFDTHTNAHIPSLSIKTHTRRHTHTGASISQ